MFVANRVAFGKFRIFPETFVCGASRSGIYVHSSGNIEYAETSASCRNLQDIAGHKRGDEVLGTRIAGSLGVPLRAAAARIHASLLGTDTYIRSEMHCQYSVTLMVNFTGWPKARL